MQTRSQQPAGTARFDSKRIFFQSSLDGRNSGWYISITSERAYGPFPDKQVAQYILDGLVSRILDRRRTTEDDTARSSADVA
jgi:hypothetical protein